MGSSRESAALHGWMAAIKDAAAMLQEGYPQLGSPDCIWYRGERADEKWTLRPSLWRQKRSLASLNTIEKGLFVNFTSRAAASIPQGATSWQILFLMQHHGIPTRLLDWTISFATALFFALEYAEKGKLPVIWQLNARALNKKFGSSYALTGKAFPPDDYLLNHLDRNPLKDNQRLKEVEAYIYPRNHPRMIAQSGMFTIHSDPTIELNKLSDTDNYLRKYLLPEDLIDEAKQFLQFLGIDRYVLFPDIENLGRSLREDYRMVEQEDENEEEKS